MRCWQLAASRFGPIANFMLQLISPSVHCQCGTPVAWSVGNELYIWSAHRSCQGIQLPTTSMNTYMEHLHDLNQLFALRMWWCALIEQCVAGAFAVFAWVYLQQCAYGTSKLLCCRMVRLPAAVFECPWNNPIMWKWNSRLSYSTGNLPCWISFCDAR